MSTQRFTGKAMHLSFGGTVIAPKAVSIETTAHMIDVSAAADTQARFVAGRRVTSIEVQFYRDVSSDPGSVFGVGATGTLIFGDQGTASGKSKWEAPVVVAKAAQTFTFDALQVMHVSLRLTGDWTANYLEDGSTF